jgi:hypothetical protein
MIHLQKHFLDGTRVHHLILGNSLQRTRLFSHDHVGFCLHVLFFLPEIQDSLTAFLSVIWHYSI